MPNYRLVLNALGLQGLKPVIYRAKFGATRPAGSSNEYSPVGDPYPAGTSYDYAKQGEEGIPQNIAGDAARLSALGTPVFCDIAFPRNNKSDLVLDTVLIDVSMRKNIVTTPVQGRPGTVKEYISDGDYEVRIRGAIVENGTSNYPTNGVRDLHEILSRSEAIPIVADYLRQFNIYNLVVTDFSFPQREGYQNVQLFEITCLSDLPEELIEENASPDQ